MKTIITNKNKPALLNNNANYKKQAPMLFKKHNFCVLTKNYGFLAFSYEASFNHRSGVDINITNASTGEPVAFLSPSIDLIAKQTVLFRQGTTNLDTNVVVYEEFCDGLFRFVSNYIIESEEL